MDLNRLLSTSLRIGVLLGAALSLAGLLLWSFQGFPALELNPSSGFSDLLRSVLNGGVVGLVYLGVMILIATPVLRVIISVFFFGMEKDQKYVAITLLVLGMLVFSLVYQAAA